MTKYIKTLSTISTLDIKQLIFFLKIFDKKIENIFLNYYSNKFDLEKITLQLSFSPKEAKIFEFILKNFKPDKNLDNQYPQKDFLKLFLLARDFYKIKDGNVLINFLIFGLIQNTDLNLKQIKENLGENILELVLKVKEILELQKTKNFDLKLAQDIVLKIKELKEDFAIAQIIYYIFEILNLNIFTDEIKNNPTDLNIRQEVREKIIKYFAFKLFIVKNLAVLEHQKIQELYADFFKVLNSNLNYLKRVWKIYIEMEEIEKEL